jgi:hypothetical protein
VCECDDQRRHFGGDTAAGQGAALHLPGLCRPG